MNSVTCILSMLFLALAPAPTPVPGNRIDLEQFTVDGIGLSSSAEDVRRILGPPEEEQHTSGSLDEQEKIKEQARRSDDRSVSLRPPEKVLDMVVYAYMTKGIRIAFEEKVMRIRSIELFIAPSPPYTGMTGSLVQGLPLEVREMALLKKYARRVYKDAHGMLYLKKDDRQPQREVASLFFSAEGWLTKILFSREDNFKIDLDRFGVAGLYLGDPADRALDLLGPPDGYYLRGKRYVVSWNREGIRLEMDRKDRKISAIRIKCIFFDGGFVQPLALMRRKQLFHDYLEGRIFQESSTRICAYRKGESLSMGKALLRFDEDDRLESLDFDTLPSVRVDLGQLTAAGVRVGDSARQVQKILGNSKKWRETRENIVVGYPLYGVRLTMGKNVAEARLRRRGKNAPIPWDEAGPVKKIEVLLKDCPWAYATPFTFAETAESYKKAAARYIFREKGDTLYLSRDGRPPDPGVAVLAGFERTGWPQSMTLKEFRNIMVDMKAFTVAGIGLGTHADKAYQILGRPQRARQVARENLQVVEYPEKGITLVIEPMNRKVVKITIDMEQFEGDFVQELSVAASADEFEKALHAQIYKQDEKHFWFTRDGSTPVWDDGLVTFGLTGDVETISFLTLGVKREGILLDITKELE